MLPDKNCAQYFILLSVLFFVSCQGPKKWASRLDSSIYKSWVHAFEEDSGKEKVYRPDGYQLPPARGREGIEIKQGGQVMYRAIGPVDVPVRYEGTWKMENKNTMLIQIPEYSEVPMRIQIVSVDKERLVTIQE